MFSDCNSLLNISCLTIRAVGHGKVCMSPYTFFVASCCDFHSYASREESFREASVKFKFLRKDVEDKETDMDVHAWEKIEYTMCDIMKVSLH